MTLTPAASAAPAATAARALIAEDEPLLAEGLRAELARLWPALEVVAVVGDGLSAAEQTLALAPEVCFFDIRMPGATGLEAAQALAEDWPDDKPFPLLVFVTAYDDHALAAFRAQAVDYVLKPLDSERLAECVARLQARLASRAPAATALQDSVAQLRSLLAALPGGASAAVPPSAAAPALAQAVPRLDVIQAQVGQTVHLVPVSEVIYFEAADKYVRVVTAEREHLIRLSLRELLPQLDPQLFWQVHRGTVVQARCVATARRDESGKVYLALRGRSETLVASRLYAHLFKGM
jgi:DNA-binding LytR/AlgR family response regulator